MQKIVIDCCLFYLPVWHRVITTWNAQKYDGLSLRAEFSIFFIICQLYGSMPGRLCDPAWIHSDKISSTASTDKISKLVFLYKFLYQCNQSENNKFW